MTENMRCELNSDNEKYIENKKINCRKLVYNKKLSGKFKLYLNDKMAYDRAFDLLARKVYIHH
ncbi:MAG: hypothetical protein M0P77_03180 [Firmicutes bacterium]|nr:hypothetical protein [Bacillota bacterium]